MFAEFKRIDGIQVAVNATAVGWVLDSANNHALIVFSARPNDSVLVDAPFDAVVEALEDAVA